MAKAEAAKAPKEPKRARRGLSLEKKTNLYGYIFVLPLIIGLAFIYVPVLIQSLNYSFSEISVDRSGFHTIWIGLANYNEALFVEADFLKTIVNSTLSLLVQIPIILIFAFFMANVLNQEFFGRAAARVIFFIPVIISTGIVSQFEKMSSMVDTYSSGEKMDVGGAGMGGNKNNMNVFNYRALREIMTATLQNADLAGVVMGVIDGLYNVITSSGVQMLIFLSGLQGISISMYESAKVEGATAWETFWKISFPMISPLILVNLLYTVIDLFTQSGNAAVNLINEKLDTASEFALASAMSWLYTLVVLLFVGVVYLLVKKLIVYQD